MTRYIDTSVIVGALAEESRTEELRLWLAGQSDLHVSWWTRTELASALARKVRDRALRERDTDLLMTTYDQLVDDTMTLLSVGAGHFTRAARLVSDHRATLRSSDALHLAIAFESDLELVTLDKRMASGGAAVGVATLLL